MYISQKTGRTLYTPDKIRNLHRNIERLTWAKEKRDGILARAQMYLDCGAERLIRDIPPQQIPRSYAVNQEHGCPNCGLEMMRHGQKGWIIDIVTHPWKVKCPHCGNLYPSNDFEAFYKSGLNEQGVFSYDRADTGLLVNELYPEKDRGFAVDDGRGWLADPADPATMRYTFIPYYVLMTVWSPNRNAREAVGLQAVMTLAEAYLITGDRKYGYPAAGMYYKMALLYPTLDGSVYPVKDGYKLAHGHTNLGRIGGCIWDTEVMNVAVGLYDMLFPCLDDGFAAWLRENPGRYIGQTPDSGARIRAEIEEQMLLRIYPDLRDYTLNCNPGIPHAMLLKTARVLQREDLFDQYADFLFKYIDHVRTYQGRLDLESLLLSEMDRDGFAGEVAPAYNTMWTDGFIEAAELLRGHKYDLYRNIKFSKLGSMAANYVTADGFTLAIADHPCTGKPGVFMSRDVQVKFFLGTGDPRDARLILKHAGQEPVCTDWYMDCEAVEKQIRKAAQGEFHSRSRCFPRFGLAAVETHPEGKDPESVAVYFGSNMGHGHRDTMALHLHGFGLNLMPDLGAPSFKDLNPERYRFTSNTVSHNTVVIPQKEPYPEGAALTDLPGHMHPIPGSRMRHFFPGEKLSVIEAEAPELYGVPYRRSCITVDTDGKSRYVVDIFRSGGEEQYISYHAMGTETVTTGGVFLPQEGGTYAGREIPFADPEYTRNRYDGFNYLTDVRRCAQPDMFTVDWTCVDNWQVWKRPRNVHLKLHMLSPVEEAALCTGFPPHAYQGNPRKLTYLLAKKTGEDAEFISVLEPYEGESFLSECSCEQSEGKTVVRVTHKNGRRDVITLNREKLPFLEVRAFSKEGECFFHESYGKQLLRGRVERFTKVCAPENKLTVTLEEPVNEAALAGRFIDVETDYKPNACYEIKNAKPLGNQKWELDTGDCTFITGFVDREHKEKGYTYALREGAAFEIWL